MGLVNMQYTFNEDEIKLMLEWASVFANEIRLSDDDKELINKMNKITSKSFDEMTNEEKVWDFLCKCDYSRGSDGHNHILYKEGKEEKRIPYDMPYNEAVKEIVHYFED